ncbi:MAG: HlyD family efflux transporter periplasmic adaptor subunit [Nitrospiraceae bacterium]|nr:HlyD family efflux transporter periplasmic adaptor subunit [Nitrospiraceae bacterium]
MDKKKLIAFLLIVVLTACSIYVLKEHGKDHPNRLILYGNVDIRQIELAFHDTGRILHISVQEGDTVSPGQLLAEMDPIRYKMSVRELEGKVDAQRQILNRLLVGSRPQEIRQARARVKADEAVLRNAKITYRRIRELARTEYASKQKLDDVTAGLETADAKLRSAREALDLAVIGPRKEDIEAARARLKAYQAALALARQKLADTKLYAPSHGVIQDRIMEPGDMAFPERPVFTVALDEPIWVRAYVPEPDMGKIVPGMEADVSTDSYPGKIYRGWIGFISPTAEFTPKNVETPDLRSRLVYQIRVYVCNANNELRLGMPATVTVRLDQPISKGRGPGSSVCQNR